MGKKCQILLVDTLSFYLTRLFDGLIPGWLSYEMIWG